MLLLLSFSLIQTVKLLSQFFVERVHGKWMWWRDVSISGANGVCLIGSGFICRACMAREFM